GDEHDLDPVLLRRGKAAFPDEAGCSPCFVCVCGGCGPGGGGDGAEGADPGEGIQGPWVVQSGEPGEADGPAGRESRVGAGEGSGEAGGSHDGWVLRPGCGALGNPDAERAAGSGHGGGERSALERGGGF